MREVEESEALEIEVSQRQGPKRNLVTRHQSQNWPVCLLGHCFLRIQMKNVYACKYGEYTCVASGFHV